MIFRLNIFAAQDRRLSQGEGGLRQLLVAAVGDTEKMPVWRMVGLRTYRDDQVFYRFFVEQRIVYLDLGARQSEPEESFVGAIQRRVHRVQWRAQYGRFRTIFAPLIRGTMDRWDIP